MKKNTTLATAEKRVINAEIKTITAVRRKIIADCNREIKHINQSMRKLNSDHSRAIRATDRETAAIDHRLGILNGRL